MVGRDFQRPAREETENERDFVGYGANPARVEWPDGARIAISVVVNYEEGSEYSLLDGDGDRETNSEVPSPLPLNRRDLANESFFEYGSRAGVWRLVVEEGGFLYDSNSYADDLPYYTDVGGKRWLVVPDSLEVNDTKFWRVDMVSPGDFYETMRNTFDRLYYEGATHSKMMNVGLHCHIAGRPSRAVALQEFLEHARSLPNVWFARRIDIARWWLQRYP